MGKSRRFRQNDQQTSVETKLVRRKVEPGTDNQVKYVEAIKCSDVTICNGLAGTGKTFLAVGMAVHMLNNRRSGIKKIVVSRPMVPGGGEDMGFLPGDERAKIDPYTAPVFEALKKFSKDDQEFTEMIDKNNPSAPVVVCPLAFMRGRTFDDSFVILDEAQNTTPEQMVMFLTRMGKNCKVVITGDLTQSDLLDHDGDDVPNGLELALERLGGRNFVKGKVSICNLGLDDIMRNDLIAELIRALSTKDGRNSRDDDRDDRNYDDDDDDDEGPIGPYGGKPIDLNVHNRLNGINGYHRRNGSNGNGHGH